MWGTADVKYAIVYQSVLQQLSAGVEQLKLIPLQLSINKWKNMWKEEKTTQNLYNLALNQEEGYNKK